MKNRMALIMAKRKLKNTYKAKVKEGRWKEEMEENKKQQEHIELLKGTKKF